MSMQVNGASASGGVNATQKVQKKNQFDDEKTQALSMAQGKPELLSKINAITPHKGALEELEAIMAQISQSSGAQQANTIGIA
jgi:hypothetical protein